MKVILDIATLLGGVAALVFFWQQLGAIRKTRFDRAPRYSPRSEPVAPRQSSERNNLRTPSTNDLRRLMLENLPNDELRTRYLSSRSGMDQGFDERRARVVRLIFSMGTGLAVWLILYASVSLTEWFLRGIAVDALACIVWIVGGAVSGVVYGTVRDSLDFPSRWKLKAIVKDINDFWLSALMWFFGVGILGYFTCFISMNWPQNEIVRTALLVVWLFGYVGSAVLSFGPAGSVYQFGSEVQYLARAGPLPVSMYIFCKYGLAPYVSGSYNRVSENILAVRQSIRATTLVVAAKLGMMFLLSVVILQLLKLLLGATLR